MRQGQDALLGKFPLDVTVISPEFVLPVADMETVVPPGRFTVFEKGSDGFFIVVIPAES